MKVLLTETVDKLGEPGDVVEVAPGYARNYLMPQGVAVAPTAHNVERFKSVREARMRELMERKEQATVLQGEMEGASLSFVRKVNPDGKIYSSVRPEEVAQLLSERFSTEIERGRVEFHQHIEEPGDYSATINLYMDITADIAIEVVAESEAAGEDGQPEPSAPEQDEPEVEAPDEE